MVAVFFVAVAPESLGFVGTAVRVGGLLITGQPESKTK